jgi:hypothetical protein
LVAFNGNRKYKFQLELLPRRTHSVVGIDGGFSRWMVLLFCRAQQAAVECRHDAAQKETGQGCLVEGNGSSYCVMQRQLCFLFVQIH